MKKALIRLVNALFDEIHPTILFGLCLLAMVVTGVLDHYSGYEFSFSIFYLPIILIVAWYCSLAHGIVLSFFCAATWLTADYSSNHIYSHPLIPFWNAGVRLCVFLLIAYFTATVKTLWVRDNRLSRHDPLTGALNIRGFFETGQPLFDLAKRNCRPFTLAYIDLDNFKRINDEKGHDEGDRVLVNVVATIRKSLRDYDLIVRVGGDEFAILLFEIDTQTSQAMADRLKSSLSVLAQKHHWAISASIGMITFMTFPETLQQGIKMADEIMYEIKKAGKNNVIHKEWCDGRYVND
jgi:diguanylate cyclase (GGDEF)-like protein